MKGNNAGSSNWQQANIVRELPKKKIPTCSADMSAHPGQLCRRTCQWTPAVFSQGKKPGLIGGLPAHVLILRIPSAVIDSALSTISRSSDMPCLPEAMSGAPKHQEVLPILLGKVGAASPRSGNGWLTAGLCSYLLQARDCPQLAQRTRKNDGSRSGVASAVHTFISSDRQTGVLWQLAGCLCAERKIDEVLRLCKHSMAEFRWNVEPFECR